ncbi:MAG TPA: HDIG domain-containing protein [Dissulfurispiraceae bacterium]|nr:HDIG domain-containing protein [Dissulfurispiraceae bacterium]
MRDMKNGIQKSSGQRVSKDIQSLIATLKEKYADQSASISFLSGLAFVSAIIIQEEINPSFFLGSFFLCVTVYFIFFKDIKRYKPLFINDHKMVLLLGLLLVATLFIGRVFDHLNAGMGRGLGFPVGMTSMFGSPIPVGAMLVALIFDFHAALMFALIISLITGVWFHNPYVPAYIFIGSLTAAFSVIRCKKRSALIKGGLCVSAVNVVTSGIILLLTSNLFTDAAPAGIFFAVMSGFFVMALVSIILPLIEHFFGVSTDISLLELLDLGQPLMKNLMINAPGTYHHSIIVGNLAEAAAEAVGANPLLARVTAYYHDIGKIKMPEYFVENQQGALNRHERLAPHMSAMILVSHVKEGLEHARQHKMPKMVLDIIQQHHGTRLMTFFYQKAKERNGIANMDEYRYPGPKPQTRVAALVMMADAVEAAARALTDPTSARISALVEKIINEIFLDGQIDECELTLKDMSEIKRRFTFVLTSIFHKRIEYPDVEIRGSHQKTDAVVEKTTHNNGNSGKELPKIDKSKSA